MSRIDLSMHEQAMRKKMEACAHDASQYKHSRRMTQIAALFPVT